MVSTQARLGRRRAGGEPVGSDHVEQEGETSTAGGKTVTSLSEASASELSGWSMPAAGTPWVQVVLVPVAVPTSSGTVAVMPTRWPRSPWRESATSKSGPRLGDPGVGITGGQIDLGYSADGVCAGIPDHEGPFDLFRSGNADSVAGVIDDLGGGRRRRRGCRRFMGRLASVQFYATGTGEVIFQALPGSLPLRASLPGTSTGPVDWGRTALQVIPAGQAHGPAMPGMYGPHSSLFFLATQWPAATRSSVMGRRNGLFAFGGRLERRRNGPIGVLDPASSVFYLATPTTRACRPGFGYGAPARLDAAGGRLGRRRRGYHGLYDRAPRCSTSGTRTTRGPPT